VDPTSELKLGFVDWQFTFFLPWRANAVLSEIHTLFLKPSGNSNN